MCGGSWGLLMLEVSLESSLELPLRALGEEETKMRRCYNKEESMILLCTFINPRDLESD